MYVTSSFLTLILSDVYLHVCLYSSNMIVSREAWWFRHILFSAQVRHLDLTQDTAKVQIFFVIVLN